MKRVFKEFDKSLYSIDIMLYSIMSFMGFFLLNSEISAEVEIYQYTISYFFIFAFFSILAYFLNRRKGDYIEILGLNGKKKVKDIFINEKVPKDIRDKYPIVVDSNDNIVWIPGLKKSKYDVLKTKNYDIILWYIKEAYNE